MQKIIDACEEILARFESSDKRIGSRWHTMTTQDFVTLTTCVRNLVKILQRDMEEID
jgi:hypothetical protein